ncbi:hypothetical protein ASG92_00285 [Arthrobacter sp. Soil736]|nr:hypothetical protein ASG92_00285 [Arthrobacter sp. Soil736]
MGTTVVAACLAAALAGCAPSAPDLESRTGKELQAQVLAVSAAAAAQDPATGLRSLDELVGHLTAAAANGEVSFKRHQSIMKAVEAVRADLLAAQAAKAAAAKAEAARAAAAKASAEAAAKAAAETAAAQSAVVSQAPARASGPAASRPPAGESRDKAPAGESRDKGSNKGKGGGG